MEKRAMADHHSTTTHAAGAAEREARIIEILTGGVLDVPPENDERAARVLARARQKFAARPHRACEVPAPPFRA